MSETAQPKLRSDLPALPFRMQKLPLDKRGYPVPWFVEFNTPSGEPDFRLMRAGGVRLAILRNICWICGEKLDVNLTFVIGPMCGVNRVSSEPPSHWECGTFAAKACPFLTSPLAKRNTHDLPPVAKDAPGVMLKHNPGVTLLWTTRTFRQMFIDGGMLLRIGAPEHVEWFHRGRKATREEVLAGIEVGLPIIEKQATADGIEAHREFRSNYAALQKWLPNE